jgi:AcrR family transcriptional regulator
VQIVSLSIDKLVADRQVVFMALRDITPAPLSDRQDTILDAAFHAFATYGYRRTSMDDIAKGAGMSRSALYLSYRNKEDIFRSLAIRYFDEAIRDMEAALNRPHQSREHAMLAAFVAKDGKFMEAVLSTPHGEELMDAGFSVTGDLAAAGEARMAEVLANWLGRSALPEGLGSAHDIARLIIAAMKGLKTSVTTLDEYREGQRRLAQLFARAISC